MYRWLTDFLTLLSVFFLAAVPGVDASAIGNTSTVCTTYGASLAIDASSIFLTDWENNRIQRFDIGSRNFEAFAGCGRPGYIDNVPALEACFSLPVAIALSPREKVLYVADHENSRIRKVPISPSSGIDEKVTTVAGNGEKAYVNGRGTDASFSDLYALAWDPDGQTLFIADGSHIRRLYSNGDVSTFASSEDEAVENIFDGSGPVRGLAYDWRLQALYISATSQNMIYRVVEGGPIQRYAGTDGTSEVNVSFPANRLEVPIRLPWGIAVDPFTSVLYVSSGVDDVVYKITEDSVRLLAGSLGLPGFQDGIGGAARFDGPSGLALSRKEGALYVADMNNHALRRIQAQGTITRIRTAADDTAANVSILPNEIVTVSGESLGSGSDIYRVNIHGKDAKILKQAETYVVVEASSETPPTPGDLYVWSTSAGPTHARYGEKQAFVPAPGTGSTGGASLISLRVAEVVLTMPSHRTYVEVHLRDVVLASAAWNLTRGAEVHFTAEPQPGVLRIWYPAPGSYELLMTGKTTGGWSIAVSVPFYVVSKPGLAGGIISSIFTVVIWLLLFASAVSSAAGGQYGNVLSVVHFAQIVSAVGYAASVAFSASFIELYEGFSWTLLHVAFSYPRDHFPGLRFWPSNLLSRGFPTPAEPPTDLLAVWCEEALYSALLLSVALYIGGAVVALLMGAIPRRSSDYAPGKAFYARCVPVVPAILLTSVMLHCSRAFAVRSAAAGLGAALAVLLLLYIVSIIYLLRYQMTREHMFHFVFFSTPKPSPSYLARRLGQRCVVLGSWFYQLDRDSTTKVRTWGWLFARFHARNMAYYHHVVQLVKLTIISFTLGSALRWPAMATILIAAEAIYIGYLLYCFPYNDTTATCIELGTSLVQVIIFALATALSLKDTVEDGINAALFCVVIVWMLVLLLVEFSWIAISMTAPPEPDEGAAKKMEALRSRWEEHASAALVEPLSRTDPFKPALHPGASTPPPVSHEPPLFPHRATHTTGDVLERTPQLHLAQNPTPRSFTGRPSGYVVLTDGPDPDSPPAPLPAQSLHLSTPSAVGPALSTRTRILQYPVATPKSRSPTTPTPKTPSASAQKHATPIPFSLNIVSTPQTPKAPPGPPVRPDKAPSVASTSATSSSNPTPWDSLRKL